MLLISTIFFGCGNNKGISKDNSTEKNIEITRFEEEKKDLLKQLSQKEAEIARFEEEKKDLLRRLSQKETEIDKLEVDIHDKEIDIYCLTEEKDYYQEFIDSYLSNLSENELNKIALKEWVYEIGIVNEKKEEVILPENGIVNLEGSSFKIWVNERQPVFPILSKYQEIFREGSIDDYRSHFKLINDDKVSWKDSSTDGTVVTAKVYDITNLKKETTVEFEISDILKSRLGLSINIIKVQIK